jgi:hypothetical protein
MPKTCAFPGCKWTQGGSSQRGWFCAKNGHDKASVQDWTVALELGEEEFKGVRNLVDGMFPPLASEAQWKILMEIEEGQVAELGLAVSSEKRFRVALARLGNDKLRRSSSLKPSASKPARQRRVSLKSARRLGQRLEHLIGPKPERNWREDYAAAVAEGMKILGQDLADFPHRATPETLHEVCTADGTHQNKLEAGFTPDEGDCLESMGLSPISLAIGKALREKSDRYSAITYAAYDILAKKAGSDGVLAPKCYHFVEGGGNGLGDEDPAWKQVIQPDEKGYKSITNLRPLTLRPADKGLFSPEGIRDHARGTDPRRAENWKPVNSTVICFESTPAEDGGKVVHSGVSLGGNVYVLPPLTLLEVTGVQESSFEYVPGEYRK